MMRSLYRMKCIWCGEKLEIFDNYAVEIGLPLVSFRPQYIYGPKSNKYDYIDWYFDRLCRKGA